MKSTESSSLKIRKLPRNKKIADCKRNSSSLKKSNQLKEKSKEQGTTRKLIGSDYEKPLLPNLDFLKSTSLICEIIRNHKQIEQSSMVNIIGKVNAIVTKIENITSEAKMSTDASLKSSHKPESVKENLPEIKKEDEPDTASLLASEKLPSTSNTRLCEIKAAEISKITSSKTEQQLPKNSESKDQDDSISAQEEINTTIHENRAPSVEPPTDYQEITISDQTIKVEQDKEKDDRPQLNSRRLSSDSANRIRRASFELKRLIFEQMQGRENLSRRDSVESALRHFDSIGADATDSSEPVSIITANDLAKERAAPPHEEPTTSAVPDLIIEHQQNEPGVQSDLSGPESPGIPDSPRESNRCIFRLCTKDSRNIELLAQQQNANIKGFEKSTNSWSVRTFKSPRHSKTFIKTREIAVTPASGKRISSRRKLAARQAGKCVSQKLLEARDSIELARVTVKSKHPACRRRILLHSNANSPTARAQKTSVAAQIESDEATPVKIQSFPNNSRVAELRKKFSIESIPKNENFFSSTTRNHDTDSSLKKTDSNAKLSESIGRKNVAPYPSSKSPDDTIEVP